MLTLLSFAKGSITTPQSVIKAFDGNFRGAKQTAWERESETEWKVEFDMTRIAFSALFNGEGTWLETKKNVEIGDLPQNVMLTLST